jgi:hypothetical protein
MTATARTEFVGGAAAIKALKSIDPEYRKQFNRDAKSIVAPLLAEAKGNYPQMPLSGMKYKWTDARGRTLLPWTVAKVRSGVKFKTSTRRNKSAVLYVTQSDPAGSIFEVAGLANPGTNFNNNLRDRSPRVLWPAADKHLPDVEQGLSDLVRNVMRRVNEETR